MKQKRDEIRFDYGRHRSRQEVLSSAKGNFKKAIRIKNASNIITLARSALSIVWLTCDCQEVLWCAKRKIEKVIHIENGLHKGQFRRARFRPILCLARACQGSPILTKRFAPAVRFAAPPLTSTVQTRDLALKDCAPGILAGKSF
jgi:hypothetical protein